MRAGYDAHYCAKPRSSVSGRHLMLRTTKSKTHVGKKRCNPSHVMHLATQPDTLFRVRAESLSPRG
jgi:hypothetical protein